MPDDMTRSALISPCGLYRYQLERTWSPHSGAPVCFVMLNPSTADGEVDDATVRRCMGFAKSWGHGGLVIVNLFAFRATQPREMLAARDAVGMKNDAFIREAADRSALIVAAWGTNDGEASRVGRRAGAVQAMLERDGHTLDCLRHTKGGHPAHPVRLPNGLTPIPLRMTR